MNTIPNLRPQLQGKTDENRANSRHSSVTWKGRLKSKPTSLGFTIIPNVVLDHSDELNDGEMRTLNLYLSMADNATGILQMGRARMADRRGRSSSSIKRHDRKLESVGHLEITHTWDYERGCPGERIIRVHRIPRPRQTVAKTVTNDPTPGVTNEPIVLINTLNSNTEVQPPYPPQAGGGEILPPVPDPQVHEALVQAREFRQQRKAERRQRRHSEARAARDSKPKTRMGRAVAHVMRCCGVCPSMWGTRLAVQTSIEKWLQLNPGGEIERAVCKLIAAWKGYSASSHLLEYPCGIKTYFAECRWIEGVTRYDARSLRRRAEVLVGMADDPSPLLSLDVGALKNKIMAMCSGIDLGDEYENGESYEDE
jgi:hypothetical protein